MSKKPRGTKTQRTKTDDVSVPDIAYGEHYKSFTFSEGRNHHRIIADFVIAAIAFARKYDPQNSATAQPLPQSGWHSLSHAEIARRAEMSEQQISTLLKKGNQNTNNTMSVGIETLLKIALACGLNLTIVTTPNDKSSKGIRTDFNINDSLYRSNGRIKTVEELHHYRATVFGDLFYAIRQRMRLSVEEIAAVLGKNSRDVKRMEAGKTGGDFSIPRLRSILEVAGQTNHSVTIELYRPTMPQETALHTARAANL